MKKNSFLKELSLMAIILSILIFAGCTKTPPAPTPTAPTLTVTFPQGTIPYGDSVSFSWRAEGKVSYVSLDGKEVAPIGSYQTKRLFDSVNSYKLVASGPGGSASKTFAINVGDWTTSVYGMISHKHWIFGYWSSKDSLTGYKWLINPKSETDSRMYSISFYFRRDGVFETRNRYTNELTSTHQWSLKSDTVFSIDGGKRFILYISKDSLLAYINSIVLLSGGKTIPTKIATLYVRDSK